MKKDIVSTLALRLWSLFSGFGTVLLIPVYLSPVDKGYYFSFLSLLGLQVFFELGLSQVLLFRFSYLKEKSKPMEAGEPGSQYLGELVFSARIVYRLMALLFFLTVVPIGYFYFSYFRPSIPVHWQWPWLILVAATSINLLHSVKFVFLEAAGRIASVATFRLRTSIVSTATFFLVLVNGGALWAVVCAPLCSAIMSSIWLNRSAAALEYRYSKSISRAALSRVSQIWAEDVWPVQWRSSISWISGYFIYQIMTPIAFARFGPAEAGNFGFINSMLSNGIIVCVTFTTVLAPRLASLYSTCELPEMNRIFTLSIRRSCCALTAFVLGFNLFFGLSHLAGTSFLARIADSAIDTFSMLMLSLSIVFSGLIYCMSIYLRSQQGEPLLRFSIWQAFITVSILLIASSISIAAMSFAYAASGACFLYWCRRIYLNSALQAYNLSP